MRVSTAGSDGAEHLETGYRDGPPRAEIRATVPAKTDPAASALSQPKIAYAEKERKEVNKWLSPATGRPKRCRQ
jgi:hypothetical protein